MQHPKIFGRVFILPVRAIFIHFVEKNEICASEYGHIMRDCLYSFDASQNNIIITFLNKLWYKRG